MNLVYKFSLNRFTMKSKKKKTNRIVSTIPFVLSRKNYLYLTFFFIFLAMMIRAFTSRIFSSI